MRCCRTDFFKCCVAECRVKWPKGYRPKEKSGVIQGAGELGLQWEELTIDRINKILNHDLFIYHLRENERAEAQRNFCHHDMAHFLDVARIGEIINLENQLGLEREWIYAAALLHDMGRHVQYENDTPHELASADIAPQILKDCGFDDLETDVIVRAIKSHRDADVACEDDLRGVLYRADKASRACFACPAEPECNWKNSKKNKNIRY